MFCFLDRKHGKSPSNTLLLVLLLQFNIRLRLLLRLQLKDRRSMATHRIKFFAVSALLLLLQSPFASSQEVDHEDEFSYERGSEIGPGHWGEIHEEWAACGHGRMQSPIDLTNRRVRILPHLGRLRRSYRPAAAVLKNRGHDIMLQWEDDAGTLRIDGKDYDLKQLHWHSPSEHTVNGRRFSLELHMVHQSADNSTAVVGILYTIGRRDPFLSNIERQIQMIADKHEAEEAVGVVDPRHIRRGSRKYYRYMGSLTTPPCTEGVVWSIVKKVRTVTREQVDLLRQAVHDDSEINARPIQQINDRMIGIYRPIPNKYA